MGMSCTLHRAKEAEIRRLADDPEALAAFLDPGTGPRVREVRPKGILGFLLGLTPIRITETDPDDDTPWDLPDPERSLDIDKAWHGLHFLLTGTAEEGEEPACFLMRGGEPLDDEGYARAFGPAAVARLARFLESVPREELTLRYDARRMAELEIYPESTWSRQGAEGASAREWLLESYRQVRDFVVRAAAAGDGIVIDVS